MFGHQRLNRLQAGAEPMLDPSESLLIADLQHVREIMTSRPLVTSTIVAISASQCHAITSLRSVIGNSRRRSEQGVSQ
jgi:hypothetical protein